MKKWPNMLLVAGTGRNVGKTTFVCQLIEEHKSKNPITAIKITPHFHESCASCKTVFTSENVVITEELSSETQKDSSKMLAAGAKKVYYVQTMEEKLPLVIEKLQSIIHPEEPVICESAALRNWLIPGYFVLLSKTNNTDKNKKYIDLADAFILNFNFNTKRFLFQNCEWKTENEPKQQ